MLGCCFGSHKLPKIVNSTPEQKSPKKNISRLGLSNYFNAAIKGTPNTLTIEVANKRWQVPIPTFEKVSPKGSKNYHYKKLRDWVMACQNLDELKFLLKIIQEASNSSNKVYKVVGILPTNIDPNNLSYLLDDKGLVSLIAFLARRTKYLGLECLPNKSGTTLPSLFGTDYSNSLEGILSLIKAEKLRRQDVGGENNTKVPFPDSLAINADFLLFADEVTNPYALNKTQPQPCYTNINQQTVEENYNTWKKNNDQQTEKIINLINEYHTIVTNQENLGDDNCSLLTDLQQFVEKWQKENGQDNDDLLKSLTDMLKYIQEQAFDQVKENISKIWLKLLIFFNNLHSKSNSQLFEHVQSLQKVVPGISFINFLYQYKQSIRDRMEYIEDFIKEYYPNKPELLNEEAVNDLNQAIRGKKHVEACQEELLKNDLAALETELYAKFEQELKQLYDIKNEIDEPYSTICNQAINSLNNIGKGLLADHHCGNSQAVSHYNEASHSVVANYNPSISDTETNSLHEGQSSEEEGFVAGTKQANLGSRSNSNNCINYSTTQKSHEPPKDLHSYGHLLQFAQNQNILLVSPAGQKLIEWLIEFETFTANLAAYEPFFNYTNTIHPDLNTTLAEIVSKLNDEMFICHDHLLRKKLIIKISPTTSSGICTKQMFHLAQRLETTGKLILSRTPVARTINPRVSNNYDQAFSETYYE